VVQGREKGKSWEKKREETEMLSIPPLSKPGKKKPLKRGETTFKGSETSPNEDPEEVKKGRKTEGPFPTT